MARRCAEKKIRAVEDFGLGVRTEHNQLGEKNRHINVGSAALDSA